MISHLLSRFVNVLLYHRIDYPRSPEFSGFAGNVSATPEMFEKHLDYIGRHYNVISIGEFAAACRGERPLPPRTVLITFDDGYLDNFKNAWPALKKRDMPAVLYLATGYVDGAHHFFWDYVADAFRTSVVTSGELPHIGVRQWPGDTSRNAVVREVLDDLKSRPWNDLESSLGQLAVVLKVKPRGRAPQGLMCSWQQLGELDKGGFAIEPHTVTHPILTRISIDEARQEIEHSRQEIKQRLDKQPVSFAYPNGLRSDYSEPLQMLVKQLDLETSFIAEGGSTTMREIRKRPHAVRRICVTFKDDVPRLAAKLATISRYAGN